MAAKIKRAKYTPGRAAKTLHAALLSERVLAHAVAWHLLHRRFGADAAFVDGGSRCIAAPIRLRFRQMRPRPVWSLRDQAWSIGSLGRLAR